MFDPFGVNQVADEVDACNRGKGRREQVGQWKGNQQDGGGNPPGGGNRQFTGGDGAVALGRVFRSDSTSAMSLMMYTTLTIRLKIATPARVCRMASRLVSFRSKTRAASRNTLLAHCLGRMVLSRAFNMKGILLLFGQVSQLNLAKQVETGHPVCHLEL